VYQRLANFDAVPCSKPSIAPAQTRGPYGMCIQCCRKFKLKQNKTLYKHRNTTGLMCTGSGKRPGVIFSKCPAGHDIAYDPITREIHPHGGCMYENRRAQCDHRGHVRSVV
jgi:hypothetical protein